MSRSNYDSDITVWSPEGKLHQVDYALQAVKQGSACVGLKSNTHVVLLGLQRYPSELASPLKKLFRADDHFGLGISGLIADGRVLTKWIRNECLNHRFVYESGVQCTRLARKLADSILILIFI
eukprot:TRINITY_DN1376_c0_g1_i1.p1 TRINITY_DN1376_c0_g1~~TRINITY_DN1376_c0_g1_i1.p1  ORF type:complete len:123 (+),score=19.26 TRINITY_DN1376_c0_g1_i1:77-445(+)